MTISQGSSSSTTIPILVSGEVPVATSIKDLDYLLTNLWWGETDSRSGPVYIEWVKNYLSQFNASNVTFFVYDVDTADFDSEEDYLLLRMTLGE